MKQAAASSTTPRPANRRSATTPRRCHRGSHASFVGFRMARRDRSCRVRQCCRCLGCVGRDSSCCALVAYLSKGKITGGDGWAPARQDTMRAGRAEMQETVIFGRAVAPCFAYRHGTVGRRALAVSGRCCLLVPTKAFRLALRFDVIRENGDRRAFSLYGTSATRITNEECCVNRYSNAAPRSFPAQAETQPWCSLERSLVGLALVGRKRPSREGGKMNRSKFGV